MNAGLADMADMPEQKKRRRVLSTRRRFCDDLADLLDQQVIHRDQVSFAQ